MRQKQKPQACLGAGGRTTSAVPVREHPWDAVYRCTWTGLRPRTSRTANTISRGCGVHGHTRSGHVVKEQLPKNQNRRPKKQEARILSASGPLKTELGGCALGDSLSRMQPAAVPAAGAEHPLRVRARRDRARLAQPHRCGTHRRGRALEGTGPIVPGFEVHKRSSFINVPLKPPHSYLRGSQLSALLTAICGAM